MLRSLEAASLGPPFLTGWRTSMKAESPLSRKNNRLRFTLPRGILESFTALSTWTLSNAESLHDPPKQLMECGSHTRKNEACPGRRGQHWRRRHETRM